MRHLFLDDHRPLAGSADLPAAAGLRAVRGAGADGERAATARRGYTLVELLVTIFIVLLITAATIPLVLPAVEGRRAREAARAVSVMLGSARSRAMELGRPCGVMLERFPGQPQFCTTLTPCEVPEPYAGDTVGSTISISVEQLGGNARLIVVPNSSDSGWPNLDWTTLLPPNAAEIEQMKGNAEQSLVRSGDIIQFGNTGDRFRIVIDWMARRFVIGQTVDVTGDGVGDYWTLSGQTTTTVPSISKFVTAPTSNPFGIPSPWDATTNWPPTASGTYRVFRQPVKSAAASLVLPESMVIDLMCSGLHGTIDLANREDHDTFYPLFWESGNVNNGMRYTAPAVDPAFFDTTTSEEQKPVTIMFGPTGSLEQIYHYGELVAPVRTVGETHDAPVYLLVARREQVPLQSALTRGNWPVSMRMESWRDATNLWVVVEPRNGRMAAFPSMIVPASDPTTGSIPLTGAPPFVTVERLYVGINVSRAMARSSVQGLGAQ